jgi:hypothetical protein
VALNGVRETLVTALVEFQNVELKPTTVLAPLKALMVLFLVVSKGSRMSITQAPKALVAAVAPVIASRIE